MRDIRALWNGHVAMISAEDAIFLWNYGFYGSGPERNPRFQQCFGLLLPGEVYYLLLQYERGVLADYNFQFSVRKQRLHQEEDRLSMMDAASFLQEILIGAGRLVYLRIITYVCLRRRGWIVQNGLNYGADFIVYQDSPQDEHATHTVIVQGEQEADQRLLWREVVAHCRVAHTARKKLIIALVEDMDKVRLLELTRFTLETAGALLPSGHEKFNPSSINSQFLE